MGVSMSSKIEAERNSRLRELIEVEVSRPEGHSTISHLRSERTSEENLLAPLDELAKKIEDLGAQSPEMDSVSEESRKEALNALSEMQKNLEQFKKQNLILRRLLAKYH
jgi:TPP-dependent pyruvate/acetoin dehydrogenase alpha subunit